MPPMRSSDSLRAVLLSANSASASGSKQGSSALTWHSLRSVGPTGISDPPGHYFPAKLALAMGLVKLFFSIFMVGLGSVAIVLKASISSIGAGVWVGIIVGVSGFLGVCAARRPYVHVYVISFLSVSILSLAASGLLIVLSATAWAKDNITPQILLYDRETQSEVDLFGENFVRRPSTLVSGLLVVLGVFDILISLACVALSAREACGSNSVHMGVFSNNDGHDKKERLYRWLGQQKYIFQSSSNGQKNVASISQFIPLSASGDSSPMRKQFSPPVGPKAEHFPRTPLKSSLKPTGIPTGISEGNSSEVTHEKRSKSSSGVTHFEKKNSSVIFLQPDNDFKVQESFLVRRKQKSKAPPPPSQPSSLPHFMPLEVTHLPKESLYSSHCPQHYEYYSLYAQAYNNNNHSFQSLPCIQHQIYAHHPPIYYPQASPPVGIHLPIIENYTLHDERRAMEKLYRKSERKRLKEKRKKREARQKRREEREQRRSQQALTDKQIDETYTGLDREIAEGFISFAMEPFTSRRKIRHSSNDHEIC